MFLLFVTHSELIAVFFLTSLIGWLKQVKSLWKKRQQYSFFRYILFFRLALIHDQPNQGSFISELGKTSSVKRIFFSQALT